MLQPSPVSIVTLLGASGSRPWSPPVRGAPLPSSSVVRRYRVTRAGVSAATSIAGTPAPSRVDATKPWASEVRRLRASGPQTTRCFTVVPRGPRVFTSRNESPESRYVRVLTLNRRRRRCAVRW
nr:hypothetical protein [Paraoerskovia sediminicola]